MTISALRKRLRQTTSVCTIVAVGLGSIAPAQAGSPGGSPFDRIPEARAGECFARVMVPAQYETHYQDVMVDEGGNRIEVSDAQFASQTQQILVRDEGMRYVVRQPVYKAVHEQVMVRPGYERLAVQQAQYRTVTEQVQIAPARTAWKPGKSLADWSGVKATKNNHGEVYCLVEIPPETKTVSRKIQIRPETVRSVSVPPVYRNISRQVLVDPGGVQEIPVPGQYASFTTQVLTHPAGQRSVAIAPRSKRIAGRVMIAPERYDWIKVLCKTNATPAAISGVQTHLQQLGYYNGQLDGNLGLSTENAIRDYQHAVGIPHGGYLSLDTMDALQAGRREPVHSVAQARAEAHAFVDSSAYTALAGAPDGGILPNQPVYREGEIISRIPPGEVPTSILPQYKNQPAPVITPRRRLTWAGKT